MDLILTNSPFYILRQNKKISTRLSVQHFVNTILKLLMREERKRSFPLYFIICLTDRKEAINLYKNNVNLTPVHCPLTFIEGFASKKRHILQSATFKFN